MICLKVSNQHILCRNQNERKTKVFIFEAVMKKAGSFNIQNYKLEFGRIQEIPQVNKGVDCKLVNRQDKLIKNFVFGLLKKHLCKFVNYFDLQYFLEFNKLSLERESKNLNLFLENTMSLTYRKNAKNMVLVLYSPILL